METSELSIEALPRPITPASTAAPGSTTLVLNATPRSTATATNITRPLQVTLKARLYLHIALKHVNVSVSMFSPKRGGALLHSGQIDGVTWTYYTLPKE